MLYLEVMVNMNLKIQNEAEEYLITIIKDNSVFNLDKKEMFKFYYQFYQCIERKNKNIKIAIGEKTIDFKNTILFSFLDYKEIMESLKFKKGNLFYEYLISCLEDLNLLEEESIFYDIVTIVKEIIKKANLPISYDIEEDLEKLIFNFVDFNLEVDMNKISEIINCLLENFISKNRNKTFIIFYNSELISLNLDYFDFCYSFDVSDQKNIEDYNLICEDEVKKFDKEMLIEKLESIWPVEFDKEKIIVYTKKYFIYKKYNLPFIAYEEFEYLTYIILSKIYEDKIDISINNFVIRNNIKSFLTKI